MKILHGRRWAQGTGYTCAINKIELNAFIHITFFFSFSSLASLAFVRVKWAFLCVCLEYCQLKMETTSHKASIHMFSACGSLSRSFLSIVCSALGSWHTAMAPEIKTYMRRMPTRENIYFIYFPRENYVGERRFKKLSYLINVFVCNVFELNAVVVDEHECEMRIHRTSLPKRAQLCMDLCTFRITFNRMANRRRKSPTSHGEPEYIHFTCASMIVFTMTAKRFAPYRSFIGEGEKNSRLGNSLVAIA